MPSITRSPEAGEPLGPLPRQFAAFIRPELPGLLNEIRAEVTRAYPVYGRLFDGPDGDAIRQGVEHTLAAFVDRVANPGQSSEPRDELLRRFGRVEAYEGRDLETLQGAYRLGARIALRRAKTVGRQHNLSPPSSSPSRTPSSRTSRSWRRSPARGTQRCGSGARPRCPRYEDSYCT